MLLTAITLLLTPLALSGLRHWIYGLNILLVLPACYALHPSINEHAFNPSFIFYTVVFHLISITLVTFTAYGWDKRQARHGGWRVPEKTLHALAFVGGTLGAYAGSKFFRHKTIKGSFRQMFIAVFIMQIAAIATFAWVMNW